VAHEVDLLEPTVWTEQVFVGRWCPSAGAITREVIEPATGAVLGVAGMASPPDVAVAAGRATEAQSSWAAVPAEYRAAVLRRAAAVLEASRDEISRWLVREAGAVPAVAVAEISVAALTCRHAAAQALVSYGELIRSAQPRLSMVRRLPIGVVGVITPFNMPLALAFRAVAPALALGNAVVLKPDPRTAITGGVVVAQVLASAGLPRDLLHIVPGGADVGEALIGDPRVGVVSFTGAASTGRRVAEIGGRLLKRMVLEVGGNGALVVLDDAELDRVIPVAGYASFLHQGQVCMAAGRHLVHESIYDEYLARLGVFADALTVGDPSDLRRPVSLGPLIDAAQRDRVHELVSASVAAGAKLIAGGRYEKLFYRPTVLAEPPEPTPGYRQEVFGPVAAVRSFSHQAEAVAMAADAALTVSIMTRDVGRGMALADRLRTGMVHINDPTTDYEPQAPFGGFGSAGNGWRAGGQADIDAYTETQWLTVSSTPVGPPL